MKRIIVLALALTVCLILALATPVFAGSPPEVSPAKDVLAKVAGTILPDTPAYNVVTDVYELIIPEEPDPK